MTIIQKLFPGVVLAAGLLTYGTVGQAQESPKDDRFVYGRCAVEAQGWRDNFGQCRLTGTDDGAIPAGQMLVIEHVAALRSGPVEHQITALALGTQLKAAQDMQTQIVLPLTRRKLKTDQRSIYQASFMTRLYAGPGTKLEPYMTLETGFVPTTGASCGVMFHGRLLLRRQ